MIAQVNWALVISCCALLVSLANLIFARNDKSEARLESFEKKLVGLIEALKKQHTDELFSQTSAITRVETNAHRRIDDLISLQGRNDRANLERLGAIESKIAAVDEHLKHIPDRRDLEKVASSMSQLSTALARVEGGLKINTDTTNRINQFLMEQGK